jgi:hypothetical protein
MLKGIGECEIELAKLANTKRRIAQMSDDFGMFLIRNHVHTLLPYHIYLHS